LNFRELVEKRYSVRGYENTPVSETTLRKLFETVRMAPSACNFQPWVFIVISDAAVRAELLKSYGRDWFAEAPVIIAAGYDRTISWKRFDGREYGIVDTAIAFDHLTLAAAEYGLGTCWIGAFKEDIVREILKVPSNIDIVALTPLGYPKAEKNDKQRKSPDQFVFRDFYGGNRMDFS